MNTSLGRPSLPPSAGVATSGLWGTSTTPGWSSVCTARAQGPSAMYLPAVIPRQGRTPRYMPIDRLARQGCLPVSIHGMAWWMGRRQRAGKEKEGAWARAKGIGNAQFDHLFGGGLVSFLAIPSPRACRGAVCARVSGHLPGGVGEWIPGMDLGPSWMWDLGSWEGPGVM